MWCHDIQSPAYAARLAALRSRAVTDERIDGSSVDDADVGPDTLVLGIETSCDETAAALVMGGSDVVSSVVSSQIDLHVPLRRRRARDRQPGPPRPAQPGHRPGHRRGRRRRAAHRRRRVHRRARPHRRAARRRVGGQGAGAGVGRPVRRRQPPRGPPLRGVARRPDDRAADRRAARVGRAHDARRDARATAATGCSARRSTTPPARRSTRSPASSASATRAARPIERIAVDGDPHGDRASRGRCSTTGSTSASPGSRRR